MSTFLRVALWACAYLLSVGTAAAQQTSRRAAHLDGSVRIGVTLAQPSVYTVEAWVKASQDVSPGSVTIAGFGDYRQDSRTALPRLGVERVSGVGPTGVLTGPGIPASQAEGRVTRNEWTHVAMVYDARAGTRTTRLYVNGRLVNQDTPALPFLAQAGTFWIGGMPNAQDFPGFNVPWRGLIDEVMVWDYARDADLSNRDVSPLRVDFIAGVPDPLAEPHLVAYFTFDQDGSTPTRVRNRAAGGAEGVAVRHDGAPLGALAYADENAPLGRVSDAAPMVGAYAVPGDFATLPEAVAALNRRSVLGDVTLTLAPGDYVLDRPLAIAVQRARIERTSSTTVQRTEGTDDDRRVTIRSTTGQASDVVIRYASQGADDNAVVRFDGAAFVALEGVTLRKTGGRTRVVWARDAEQIVLRRTLLEGGGSGGNSGDDALVHAIRSEVAVVESRLRQAGNAFTLEGVLSRSDRQAPVAVLGCTVDGVKEGLRATGAHFLRVEDSRFTVDGGIGLYLLESRGLAIERNRIDAGTALQLDYTDRSPSAVRTRVANNVLVARTRLAFSTNVVFYLDALHNTFVSASALGTVQLFGTAIGPARMAHNLFVNEGSGAALHAFDLKGVSGEANAFYAAASEIVTGHTTVGRWDAASGWTGSAEAWPGFRDAGAGDYTPRSSVLRAPRLADVPVDADGQMRPEQTTLGALHSPASDAPFVGAAAPGGSLQDVFDALALRGVSGPTTVALPGGEPATGAYVLRVIPGAFPNAFVTLDGAGTEVLSRSDSPQTSPMLRVVRPYGVTLRGLAFRLQGTPHRHILTLEGHAERLNVDLDVAGDHFLSPAVTGLNLSGGLLTFSGRVRGGGAGVYLTGRSDNAGMPLLSDVTVRRLDSRHTVVNSRALDIASVARLTVLDSRLEGELAAVLLNRVRGGSLRSSVLASARTALQLLESSAPPATPFQVVNTFVRGGEGAVWLRTSDHVQLLHNTLEATGSPTTSVLALWAGGTGMTGIGVRNNVLTHAGGGAVYALGAQALAPGAQFGPNLLHTPGAALGRRDGQSPAASLDDLRTLLSAAGASEAETNGRVADPALVTISGGMRAASNLAAYGAAQAGVSSVDFRRRMRAAPAGGDPDFGALEYDEASGFALAHAPAAVLDATSGIPVRWTAVNAGAEVRILLVHPEGNAEVLASRPAADGVWTWQPASTLARVSGYRLAIAPVSGALADTTDAWTLQGTSTSAGPLPVPPAEPVLDPPAPHPARGIVTLGFRVAASGPATLELFDGLGRRVARLYEGTSDAGAVQRLRFDASTLAPGVYQLRLTTGRVARTQALVVVE